MLLGLIAVVLYFYFKPPPPPISDEDRARTEIMPLPAMLEYGNGSFDLSNGFAINFQSEPNAKLTKAVDRFKNS